MKFVLTLPNQHDLSFEYDETVYNPNYTQLDVVSIADIFIKKSRPDLKVLDLACGTGVLGLSVKYLNPEIDLTLSDISPDAIKIAKKNARSHNIKCKIKT